MKDEALKLALEALEAALSDDQPYINKSKAAITAIKQALALDKKAENARALGLDYEPVGWWDSKIGFFEEKHFDQLQPLYTTPPAAQPAPVQEPLSELEKDAANLLFALHDAWPYVHGNCTIESKRKAIQALIVKHGDFADLHPPAAQRQWVGLTDEQITEICVGLWSGGWRESEMRKFARAIEAKLKEKNT